MKTIQAIAKEIATTAVEQGLTSAQLHAAGADLFDADIDYAAQELGRTLSRDDRKELWSEYVVACDQLLAQ